MEKALSLSADVIIRQLLTQFSSARELSLWQQSVTVFHIAIYLCYCADLRRIAK
jgi:hypothetical protein